MNIRICSGFRLLLQAMTTDSAAMRLLPQLYSIFLGDEITEILECIADGRPYNHFDVSNMDTGLRRFLK